MRKFDQFFEDNKQQNDGIFSILKKNEEQLNYLNIEKKKMNERMMRDHEEFAQRLTKVEV